MSTTRPLPSHSAQVKETRRSLYDSESGVKEMAVGHHLDERSHTIVRSQLALKGEGGEAGLCQLGRKVGQSGSGTGWKFGCGTGELSGSGSRGSGVGVCVRRLVLIALVQCSGAVGSGVERCAVFERRGTRARPTAGQPNAAIRSSLSLGQHR